MRQEIYPGSGPKINLILGHTSSWASSSPIHYDQSEFVHFTIVERAYNTQQSLKNNDSSSQPSS